MRRHWPYWEAPIWRTTSRISPCSSSKKPPLSIPRTQPIKTQVGVSEIDIGQSEQGLAALEQVFGTEAGAPMAGPTLVVMDLHAQRLDKAAEVAASLIKRDAKNPIYHTLLGIVRAAQKDYPGSESAFRAALQINPDLPDTTRDLAQIYAATNRPDEARNLYNELLTKNPNEVSTLLGLADTYIAQQKWTEAIDTLNRARSAARNGFAAAAFSSTAIASGLRPAFS